LVFLVIEFHKEYFIDFVSCINIADTNSQILSKPYMSIISFIIIT
jgi:hypothetical protein